MRETAYTSAVTRIRANENNLLTRSDLDRLLAARDAGEVLQFLTDKGYGGERLAPEEPGSLLFTRERERAWSFIREIAPDFTLFFPMLVRNDFHDLKAILKGTLGGVDYKPLLLTPTVTPLSQLESAVADRKFAALPGYMAEAASLAYDALAHTGDGQLADITLDRAYLDAVMVYADGQKEPFVTHYCRCVIETADLRIAARCARLGKSIQFLEQSLAPCGELDVRSLREAAVEGVPALTAWLEKNGYAGAGEALKQSVSALERWCDDRVIASVREARYAIFGLSPLYQYLVSKEAEISAVRIIYTGKRAGFSEEKIRSYLRALV